MDSSGSRSAVGNNPSAVKWYLSTGNCKLQTGNLFLSPVKQIFAQHHQQEGKCSTEDHPDKSDEEFPETENFEIKQDKMMDEDQDQAIIDEPFDILVL
jgi:hypothetical protein